MKTHFDRMFDGISATCEIEDHLYDKYDWIEYIGWDHYDSSLEIHCGPSTPSDWQFTLEDVQIFPEWGFVQAWLNFHDGTEQHVTLTRVGERRKVNHPQYAESTGRLSMENRALKRQVLKMQSAIGGRKDETAR